MTGNPFGDHSDKFKQRYFDLFSTARVKTEEHKDYMKNNPTSGEGPEYVLEWIEIRSKSPLMTFLDQLSHDEIKAIKTVMYIGRDKDHNQFTPAEMKFNAKLEDLDFIGNNSKEIDIETIIEKEPLGIYLLEGMRILGMYE